MPMFDLDRFKSECSTATASWSPVCVGSRVE